jgi:hypothetical protein
MDKNYDEVLSDILIQLDAIERRMAPSDTRLDLTVKRLVMIENKVEMILKKQDHSMMAINEFIAMQSKLNRHFLEHIEKNPSK